MPNSKKISLVTYLPLARMDSSKYTTKIWRTLNHTLLHNQVYVVLPRWVNQKVLL